MYGAKQHSYEELRDVVLDVLQQGAAGNQYATLLEHTARRINQREGSNANLGTGIAYQGADAALHPNDRGIILEVFWDLFRQGVITLGLNDSNPGWPFFRLSRFGASETARHPLRFHDTASFIALATGVVPDLLDATKMYLEEAVAAFYSGCHLAATVMLGVAAEAEFLRLIEVANDNQSRKPSFEKAAKEKLIKGKIDAFRKGLEPHLKSLSKPAQENLDTHLNAIQAIIRVARNEAGHPSGATAPAREQVYVNMQLFVPYAVQILRLRQELK